MNKKVLIIANDANMFFNFRGDLAREMVKHNCEVSVVVPRNDMSERFVDLGVEELPIKFDRLNKSFLKNIAYISKMKRIIKDKRPDIVFSYSAKPVIIGSIAAHMAGVRNIYSMMSGLGQMYESKAGLGTRVLRFVCGRGYKMAFKYNKKVIFQNQDDLDEFVSRKYLPRKKCALVDGSGVNMERFLKTDLPKNDAFLMVARPIPSKGVLDYMKAAQIVKEKYPKATFVYIGKIEASYNSVTQEDMAPFVENHIVDFVNGTDDVPKYLAKARVFVLPSYYREGIPRSLLEALASGRPIITTNLCGCKETINSDKNGLYAESKNPSDLADKMMYMIEHSRQTESMGEESYKYCKIRFDVTAVNRKMLSIMGISK